MAMRDKAKFGYLYMLTREMGELLTSKDWNDIQSWPYQSHQGSNYLIITSGMFFRTLSEQSEVVVALWTMDVLKDRDSELGTRTWEELEVLLEAERMPFKYMIGTTQKIALQCAAAMNKRIADLKALIETKGLKMEANPMFLLESTLPTPQCAVVLLDQLERQIQMLEDTRRSLSSYEHRHALQHASHLVSIEDNRKSLNPRTLADAAS